jgi:hypothetical protein
LLGTEKELQFKRAKHDVEVLLVLQGFLTVEIKMEVHPALLFQGITLIGALL